MEPKGNKSDGATHLAAPSRKRYLARGIEGYRGADLKNDLPVPLAVIFFGLFLIV